MTASATVMDAHALQALKHADGEPRLLSASKWRLTCRTAVGPWRQYGWLFEFFVAGRLEIDAADTGWRLCLPQTGVLYAPWTPYRQRLPRDGPPDCQTFCAMFDPGELALLPSGEPPAPFVVIEDPEDVIRPLMQRLVETWLAGDEACRLIARGCFLQWIGHVLLAQRRGSSLCVSARTETPPGLVASAHKFMRERMGDRLRIADIARHLGVSNSGFAHAYRRATGESPMAALRRIRVDAAHVRLLRGGQTLAQIAEETGFADAFHLSRVFKRLVGHSPRAIRAADGAGRRAAGRASVASGSLEG